MCQLTPHCAGLPRRSEHCATAERREMQKTLALDRVSSRAVKGWAVEKGDSSRRVARAGV
eukprot:1188114-Prorocentrum_minimum.AAC.2